MRPPTPREPVVFFYLNLRSAYFSVTFVRPPKRPRPKKGSFDWLYNQGEKSYLAKLNNEATKQDYANMRTVAEAYRTGNGVRQNLRLAECWEEMAQP